MAQSADSAIFRPGLLEGQICVVSGAGTGLGREASLELMRLGATVVGCGRRVEPLEETAAAAEGLPGSFEHEALDIREEEAVDAFFDRILERHPRIDLLLNNAGGQFLAPAETITPKGFQTVTELNVQGTWLMTHAAATKAFIPQGAGKVISVTISPHHGMPGMAHSGAARAGVENLTRTLSVEWARHGVKLVAIAAGQFDTETLRTKYPQQIVDQVADTIPLGRMGTESEFAWMVAYLASPAGDFHSGSVITIDGARDNWFGSWPPGTVTGDGGEPLAEER